MTEELTQKPMKEMKSAVREAYDRKHPIKPEPGSHAEDVLETTRILQEIRKVGHLCIPNTVDGQIDILFDRGKKSYSIIQTYNGKVVSYVDVIRRSVQGYLIELRERRREQDRKEGKVRKKSVLDKQKIAKENKETA